MCYLNSPVHCSRLVVRGLACVLPRPRGLRLRGEGPWLGQPGVPGQAQLGCPAAAGNTLAPGLRMTCARLRPALHVRCFACALLFPGASAAGLGVQCQVGDGCGTAQQARAEQT